MIVEQMDDEKFIELARSVANESTEQLKCGSVLVDTQGNVIAKNYNSQHSDNLTASHAEMKSIAEANQLLGRKLVGVTAYSTCEPCTMCLTALIFARVDRIVFAERLKEVVRPDQVTDVDSFEFIKKFPYQPNLEQIHTRGA